MMQTKTRAAEPRYTVFNSMFEGFSNETLYAALCAATAPLNEGLEELQRRLKPIIINASRAFLGALSWTMDDAMGEALILIWELVKKNNYKYDGAPFDRFFAATWANRLNSLFQKTVMKNPVMRGDLQIGWCDHKPILVCAYGFHEKSETYRAKRAERARQYYDRQLAAQGKTRQPVKPKMTDEERREKNRLRLAAKRAAETPEEAAARKAKNNERRKIARENETPEQREARLEKRRAYEAAKRSLALA